MKKIESFFLGVNIFQGRFKFSNTFDTLYLNTLLLYTLPSLVILKNRNSKKIAVVNAVCDTGLLTLPDNGKSWNFNADKKRWELECEVDYEHEKSELTQPKIYQFV